MLPRDRLIENVLQHILSICDQLRALSHVRQYQARVNITGEGDLNRGPVELAEVGKESFASSDGE